MKLREAPKSLLKWYANDYVETVHNYLQALDQVSEFSDIISRNLNVVRTEADYDSRKDNATLVYAVRRVNPEVSYPFVGLERLCEAVQ